MKQNKASIINILADRLAKKEVDAQRERGHKYDMARFKLTEAARQRKEDLEAQKKFTPRPNRDISDGIGVGM